MPKQRISPYLPLPLLFLVLATQPAAAVNLLSEDFEGVPLQPTVTFESELRSRAAWQTVDDSGLSGWTEVNLTTSVGDTENGVLEFEGWRFVDKQWWIETAGDQGRTNFVSGVGTIAVADPDEWDDFGNPDQSSEDDLLPENGVFDSTLVTPSVAIGGVSEPVRLNFSSSWFDEDLQTATLTATYNTGDPEVLDVWTSVPTDPNFKDDAFDESLTYELQAIPAGATSVQFEFRLQGNNDWWWAIDNVRVYTGDNQGADGVLKAVLDRDSGEVTILNNTGVDVQLRGYSLFSIEGAFDEAAADFLSATDSDWVQATQVGGEVNDLSELHLSSMTLASGASIQLGEDAWLRYFEENKDIQFTYLVEGSNDQITGLLEFVGNGGEGYQFLDLNFDGTVDINDWTAFLDITDQADLSSLTTAQAYLKGDLNEDGKLSAGDYMTFQREFDRLLGAGAFAAALSGTTVPEPSSGVVALLAIIVVAIVTKWNFVGRDAVADSARASIYQFADGYLLRHWGRLWAAVLALVVLALPQVSFGQRLPDGVGVTEWEEWAFADREWWSEVAGNQQRADFTLASGVVAIADPDEWDDIGGPGGTYTFNSQLRTPAIDLTGVDPGSLNLTFASSWRPEDTQGASLDVFYDGVATEVFRWSSDAADANYKDDAPNEMVSIPLPAAGSATTMQLGFNMFNATNDWWWAIDNVNVSGNTGSLLFENFESVVLGEAIDENPDLGDAVYSQEGPAGWVVNTDNYTPPVSLLRDPHPESITRFIPPPPPATLELQINTASGNATLVSVSDDPVVLTSYSISSEAGALMASEWEGSNLDARNVDGVGGGIGDSWDTVIATPELLFEAFLNGDTTISPGGSLSIGKVYDKLVGGEDLVLAYSFMQTDEFGQVLPRSSETAFAPVVVNYVVPEGLEGDFNGDGLVNLADYTVWRNNLGGSADLSGNGNETGASAGVVDAADYTLWKQNYGATAAAVSATAQVPEPSAVMLVLSGVACCMVRRLRFGQRLLVAALALVSLLGATANAQLPPAPFVDRDYGFGDDDTGAVIGQRMSLMDNSGNVITYDGAGQTNSNQLIDLIAQGRLDRYPVYTDTTDRPDGNGGIGLGLNQGFDRNYLRTGFGEALNYPEQSPSSIASLVNPGGTLNYFRLNDRGFELWVKPTDVLRGEQHIVMDSQQHGVFINSEGKFAMRYASEFDIDINVLPGDDGELGTEDDVLEVGEPEITPADYVSDVAPVNNEWYHLAVVRPRGPGNGSIFYVNGIAEAVGFGNYAIETVVNIGEGDLFTNIAALDNSPLYVGARTDATQLDRDLGSSNPELDFYFDGVVDDLEMFVMGLNDNDNLVGGGTNQLNDWGEYIFQRDNGYAEAFAPAVDGDLNDDGMVTEADAGLFVVNWLTENRLQSVDPFNGAITSRLVGDLSTRALGDFDYNGKVDLEDWAILNNANPAVGALALRLLSTTQVPEPTATALVGLAVAMSLTLAAKRRHDAR